MKGHHRLKYVVGGIEYPGINKDKLSGEILATEPGKSINYASAHDNHTLHDKLMLSISFSKGILEAMQKQANAIVLTAQGVPFIHAGRNSCVRNQPERL